MCIMLTMTKYILHGGNAQEPCSDNNNFFIEILKDTKMNTKILLVHFAGRPEKAILNKAKDIDQFKRVQGDKILEFEVADEQSFLEKIKRNDIIYLGGGTTVRLLETLRKFPNLKNIFKGKIIAGESAGANALATYCYSKSAGGVFQGLGILPIKVIPHYETNLNKVLDSIGSNLEEVFLPEYKFRVFEA